MACGLKPTHHFGMHGIGRGGLIFIVQLGPAMLN